MIKIKEFHELRLGQQTMEEYANKFLGLLRYARYIKDEKVKIQSFLSGLPQPYKDTIKFYEPRTLEDMPSLYIIFITSLLEYLTSILA